MDLETGTVSKELTNCLAKWTGEQNVDASEVFVRWENQKRPLDHAKTVFS